jgi:heat shock protein HtpX
MALTPAARGAARASALKAARPLGALGAQVGPSALLVLAGAALLAVGAVLGGAVLIAAGLALLLAASISGAPGRILHGLPVRAADPVGDARLINLVEAHCIADGLPVPELRVLEDPAANAVLLGRRPHDAVLVVTSGLLRLLDRMELEAVVAHELSHAKRGDLAAATAAMRAVSLLAWTSPRAALAVLRLAGPTREALADQAAVRVTRYPPALASALDKLAEVPTRPASLSASSARLTGPLWCAPLEEARPTRPMLGVLDLPERASALREL